MNTPQNKLTPFIRPRKYFACLIFIVEGDEQTLFDDENFPNYPRAVTDGSVVYVCYHINSERDWSQVVGVFSAVSKWHKAWEPLRRKLLLNVPNWAQELTVEAKDCDMS